MQDNWVTITRAAKECGVSNKKIKNLIKNKLISINKDGKVSLEQVRAVLEAEKEMKMAKIKEEQDYTELIKRANAKYRVEKAKLVELQRKEKERLLIKRKEVENLLVEIANSFKKKLYSWRAKLAARLEKKTKAQIFKILDEEIEELLNDISEKGLLGDKNGN